jgi:hypothetical protein
LWIFGCSPSEISLGPSERIFTPASFLCTISLPCNQLTSDVSGIQRLSLPHV